jgi:NAD(P)-dependent dehydrogenase (short-subunit alcohol dehydrogenase family)
MASPQQLLASQFDAFSTADDVIGNIDLRGKVAIVTGGHSNLGLETARVLATAGAQIIIPARDPAVAALALQNLPGAEIETLDLMDPASIDGFAQRFLTSDRALDILMNSAGIMAAPLARDALGNEAQFSTNHLGHFRLACRLWPALRRASGARVVAVSSRAHQLARVDFDDINFNLRAYDKWLAYGQSKTANILFAVGLDARGRDEGIRGFSVHPGSILGPLARHLSDVEIDAFGARNADGSAVIAPDRDMKSAAQGAATSVWCATSPDLNGIGGVYCENSNVAPLWLGGSLGQPGVADWAIDPDDAERLWIVSQQMAGSGID